MREVVDENASLRCKLASLKDYLVTTESEQLSNRDKMIDLINEQCNLTRLADNVDVLIQVVLLFIKIFF